jgi:hypothetical protein
MILLFLLSCEPPNPELETCYVRCEQNASDCEEQAWLSGADCSASFETCIIACNIEHEEE